VGNRPHGVRLPYNYQSRKEWEASFANCGLSIAQWTSEVPLYPFPFSLLVAAPCISSPSWKRCNRAAMPVVIPPARNANLPIGPPRLPPDRWCVTTLPNLSSRPERPDFFLRANYGASAAEWRIPLPPPLSFAFLLSPGRWSLTTLPNSVIPTGGGPIFSSRRTMARRAAEWRDPSSSPASLLLFSCLLVAGR